MKPTTESVRAAIALCRHMGEEAFRDAVGAHHPRSSYLRVEDELLPLKAIWAAAHNPPVKAVSFRTGDASKGLRGLGFNDQVRLGPDGSVTPAPHPRDERRMK